MRINYLLIFNKAHQLQCLRAVGRSTWFLNTKAIILDSILECRGSRCMDRTGAYKTLLDFPRHKWRMASRCKCRNSPAKVVCPVRYQKQLDWKM